MINVQPHQVPLLLLVGLTQCWDEAMGSLSLLSDAAPL